ncbi:protein phosphatase 1 regulatory subunit 3B-like isoform X2 [Melanaphis sacchari]|uniref:Protein phosphatase 1 regulatory subunit 3B n=2 Tax=Melanaphis sacchari TaxID=742174 RepID=A0A2H8TQS1_9HEMI|nr:protein phosphatase 1 regulatory subunit 3B-like isoform X2 [Melanaphis sacchari]XP_025196867.1 protein phosphatase 1 regulatory subunit 3B-like isoform X2 [Melanaphis sacchari]
MLTECCDVMVAHSPPIYSGPQQDQLSVLYQNFRLVVNQKQPSPLSIRRSSFSPTRSDDRQSQVANSPSSSKPRRPCLVVRTDSECSIGSSSSSSSDENEPSSPIRRKKKVVFADDRGLSLTQVRLMNEPSNQPPKLMTTKKPYFQSLSQSAASSLSFLQADATGGTNSRSAAGAKHLQLTGFSEHSPPQWNLRFLQPASSYMDFRKRLDTENVSLENVIVRSPDRRIVGTVKVRNLSYDKDVFIRSTHDRWADHADTPCMYVQNNAMLTAATNPAPNVAAIYDTFSFQLPLPVHAMSMEFAVCYRSSDFECWDNNDGLNYCVSVGSPSNGAPMLPQQQLQQSPLSPGLVADFDHHPKQPVHYFGAQSRQNSWSTWRDQKTEGSAYW